MSLPDIYHQKLRAIRHIDRRSFVAYQIEAAQES